MTGSPGFLAALAALFFLGSGAGDEVRARWHCEPAEVEVGQPFEVVLELTHPVALAGGELLPAPLELDPSWVVLAEEPTTRRPEGTVVQTRHAWRVASLEPGERSLADALSALALSRSVSRIEVGDAHVRVTGVLGQGEDAPRPLREFNPEFTDGAGARAAPSRLPWAIAGLVLLAGLGAWLALRWRARRGGVPAVVADVERLSALERGLEGERGRESCFELTRLLREVADRVRGQSSAGLTDEEWLLGLNGSHAVPRAVQEDLAQVFAHAARVKYAGEPATAWALADTFARARAVLAGLPGTGART